MLTPAAPRVSRRTATGEGGVPAEPIAAAVGAALRSPGRPLYQGTRAYFEPRFGHDFGWVRIHADAPAAASARALGARTGLHGRVRHYSRHQWSGVVP
jgi:hypothetical protein